MIYTHEFNNEIEKQTIIDNNQNLRLLEEQNLFSGNYLIYTDDPDTDVSMVSKQIEELKTRDAGMQEDINLIYETLGG